MVVSELLVSNMKMITTTIIVMVMNEENLFVVIIYSFVSVPLKMFSIYGIQ